MKFTDALADILRRNSVAVVHSVTGGAVVHILDSMRAYGIEVISYHNEQAASLAAVGSAKATKSLACCVVTTGPGGTNAMTGLASAWVDSVPVLFVSGQARREHLSADHAVRQIGAQELDIVATAGTLSKTARTIVDSAGLESGVVAAIRECLSDRPGPAWLDFPLDLQFTDIAEPALPAVTATPSRRDDPTTAAYFDRLSQASRPAFLIGGGTSVGARQRFTALLERQRLPYVVTYTSMERTETRTSKHNHGVPGIAGRRSANAILNNADNVTVIGSHLPVPLTGSNTALWCAGAVRTMVNIDKSEFAAARVNLDYTIDMHSDRFIELLIEKLETATLSVDPEWPEFSEQLAAFIEPRPTSADPFVDLFAFMGIVSEVLIATDLVVVDGGGTVNAAAFTMLRPFTTTPLIMSSGLCVMGSGIPEAIGAYVASGRMATSLILLVGDGGLQFNLQELSTIRAQEIPVKIFVINNLGYTSIRNTQMQFLDGRELGVSPDSGLWFPDLRKVADTFDLAYERIDSQSLSASLVDDILHSRSGATLVEVLVDPMQQMGPMQGFREISPGRFAPLPLSSMSPAIDTDIVFDRWVSS